jgi:hypothetical protein
MAVRANFGQLRAAGSDDPAADHIKHRLGIIHGLFVNIRPEAVLQELAVQPERVKLDVWRVLRTVQLWFSVPADRRGILLYPAGLERLESEILFAAYDAEIRSALGVIVGAMRPETETVNRMALACLTAADWATGQSAFRTMTGFAVAAALASDAPTYWLVAELAVIRYRLRTEGAAHPHHRRLVEWRTALEEEIARVGGPGATRDGLSILRSIRRKVARADSDGEASDDAPESRMGA